MDDVLRRAHRIAVLGIKPESRRHRAAHYIPAYLADVGYDIIPVPVYYPEVTEILSVAVCRSLLDVQGQIDILSVFRRVDDFEPHLEDILRMRPGVVWFQSGLIHVPGAQVLSEAGIRVVHDCIGCRRAAIPPAAKPLEGQLTR